MTNEAHLTPALEAAALRRRELREALVAFEGALASPIRDRETWRAEVADALESLGHAFEDHVPRRRRPAACTRDARHVTSPEHEGQPPPREHPEITAALVDASARVAVPPADDAAADAIRDDLQRLMGQIVRHRQHGADLVWEAYAIDIGDIGAAG